jgi:hypothetical protein
MSVLDNLNSNPIAPSPFGNEVPVDSTASLLDFGRTAGDDTNSLVSWQRDAMGQDPFSAMVREVNQPATDAAWMDQSVSWQTDPYLAGLPPTPARMTVGLPQSVGAAPEQRAAMPPVQHAPMVQMMFQAQGQPAAAPQLRIPHAMPQHAMPPHAMPQHAMPQHAMPQHAMPQHAMPQHAMPQHAMPQQFVPQPVVQPVMRQQVLPPSMNVAQMMMTSQMVASPAMAPHATGSAAVMASATSLLLEAANAGAVLPTPFALARGVDAPVIAPLNRALPFVASRARRSEIDPLIVAYHKGKKRQRRNAAVGRLLMYLAFIATAAGSYAGYLWYKR